MPESNEREKAEGPAQSAEHPLTLVTDGPGLPLDDGVHP